MEQNRKRGGQKGNRNALKHGYYSKIFSGEEIDDFCKAGDVQGIDEEIALMRHVIKKAASANDDKKLLLMVRAANALNKLIRTRQKMKGKYEHLNEAIRNVVVNTLEPMGVNIGASLFGPRGFPDVKTNNENEADLP